MGGARWLWAIAAGVAWWAAGSLSAPPPLTSATGWAGRVGDARWRVWRTATPDGAAAAAVEWVAPATAGRHPSRVLVVDAGGAAAAAALGAVRGWVTAGRGAPARIVWADGAARWLGRGATQSPAAWARWLPERGGDQSQLDEAFRALKAAAAQPSGPLDVLLVSELRPTAGEVEPAALQQAVASLASQGIRLSILPVGDADRARAAQWAAAGGGVAYAPGTAVADALGVGPGTTRVATGLVLDWAGDGCGDAVWLGALDGGVPLRAVVPAPAASCTPQWRVAGWWSDTAGGGGG